MSKPTDRPSRLLGPDRVEQFLRDINVFLGVDYADLDRPPLQVLAPHFAQLADLALADRIAASYEAMRLTPSAEEIRDIVRGALLRCAGSCLGIDRSFVVLDSAYDICREAFTSQLWSDLLLRQQKDDLPFWVRGLALRFTQWGIKATFSSARWHDAIKVVHPTGFEPLFLWGREQVSDTHPIRFRRLLLKWARERIASDAGSFRRAFVDTIDLDLVLDDCEHEFGGSTYRSQSDAFNEGNQAAYVAELLQQICSDGGEFAAARRDTADLPLPP